jgi:tetratricopeptide (TPR) repeat protein
MKVFLTLCLLLWIVPVFSQTPEEFIRKAQAAEDSNHRVVIYDKAIKKHPGDSRLYHKRGIAYGIMEHHDKAFKDFDKSIALDPSVAAYYHDRGLALHRLKRNDEAIRDFTKLIELEPGNARAYYLRAVSYTNLKQLDKAEPDLDRAVQLDPKLKDNGSVRQMRGLIKSKRPLISIGSKNAPQAASASPAPAAAAGAAAQPVANAEMAPLPELEGAKQKALANKARVRVNLKKYGEAAEVWAELLELAPGYYPAYAERAYALHMAGEKDKASEDLKKAFVAGPEQPRALLLRAAISCADGNFGQASSDLARALELDPKIKRDRLYRSTSNSVKFKKDCK